MYIENETARLQCWWFAAICRYNKPQRQHAFYTSSSVTNRDPAVRSSGTVNGKHCETFRYTWPLEQDTPLSLLSQNLHKDLLSTKRHSRTQVQCSTNPWARNPRSEYRQAWL